MVLFSPCLGMVVYAPLLAGAPSSAAELLTAAAAQRSLPLGRLAALGTSAALIPECQNPPVVNIIQHSPRYPQPPY